MTSPPQRTGYGDTESFACVAKAWESYKGELRGFLRHRLADPDAADDVMQDVFIKAMRQGRGFCSLDNPRAWLFQVARNALVDRQRVARPTEALTEGLLESAELVTERQEPVDALADCLTRVLGELPPADAAILHACDLHGQTLRGFAEANGLSLPATKSRLQRARQRLRTQMTAVCQVSFEPDGSVAGHVPRPAG